MQPVQIDAQPIGERREFVGSGDRSAREPFMRGLRGNRASAAMTQIELQRELRPARRFLRAALQGKFEAFRERRFLFCGRHRKIVQSSRSKEDNHSRQF